MFLLYYFVYMYRTVAEMKSNMDSLGSVGFCFEKAMARFFLIRKYELLKINNSVEEIYRMFRQNLSV